MEVRQESIYDNPIYYDLIFGSDWAAEFKFLKAAFAKHLAKPPKRLFEPACGTGRLVYRFAKAGYQVDGIDLNPKAIEYCNRRLQRHSLAAKTWVADMSDFQVKRPYDAAFNTINSFRHLTTEAQAVGHLRSMADAIRPGGFYALGLHLTPQEGTPTDHESWSARRGHLVVHTQMWPRDKDTRTRIERFNIRFDIHRPSGSYRIDDCLVLRSYTWKQFQKFIDSGPQWEIEATYDFRYSIDDPIEVDPSSEDVVYMLKRRA
jgi:SAM-dependent methyltransferase